MKKKELINKKFDKQNLILTIAKYQIYYQMALGLLVKQTCFDKDEMTKKLEELKLDIDVENVLNVMIKLIDSFCDEKDFEEIFDDNIKLNSLLHALKDFTEQNSDLTNKEKVYNSYKEKIMKDEFFDVKMQLHFDDELEDRAAYWKDLITDNIANEVKQSALKIIEQ
ncbi:hypothetical protein CP960_08375 [Malaciobacter halophilus]|uniref:Uncharacterized protein n=1 Tax=Malaciobacter halophilus TaxID=197482 RepID=A0A2N1J1Y1_9BACT|nr:hypothetical protein [Malaciobacter halophilus]AXH10070.1 hypothetical protein AHALO_1705 [Malaciobacter halophilus]PKI80556.1 hypothetical protein CP960_08375 [Malaciobacter halophilus]